MNFEQTFKNIDDILFKDSGADSELDYIGQTSWILFLRYLEDLEEEKAEEAALMSEEYSYILDEKFRWHNWAMPKDENGKLDNHTAMTGLDLVGFVNNELFPYLAKFNENEADINTIEYKIGEIYSELKNKIQSGYNLREIIEYVDDFQFRSSKDKHELSHLYETKIKNMGNAGRNGGQYYTPRPLIRAMIEVVNPVIGETVYDGAAGSGGFLCEAFDYISDRMEKSTKNLQTLQNSTFYAREKKNLAYVIGVMNMILHGIEAPNIIHTNTLSIDLKEIKDADRYNVILANPPFGGKERHEIQTNFNIKTGETAYLFLQHFIRSLKANGRAAIVIKNTFLSNTDNASIALRKHLLDTCDLHTILDMPGGTFLGAGVKTVVLFFTKGTATKKTWFYQLNPGRNMGKKNPLNDEDLVEFIQLQKTKPETEKSWILNVDDIPTDTYDLSAKNSNTHIGKPLKNTEIILAEMKALDTDIEKQIIYINNLLQSDISQLFDEQNKHWKQSKFSELFRLKSGDGLTAKNMVNGDYPVYGGNGIAGYHNEYNIEGPVVIIGRVGALCGNVRLVEERFWLTDNAFKISNDLKSFDLGFLTYALNYVNLRTYARQAAQPVISNSSLKDIIISYPSNIDEQKEIKSQLDLFEEHKQILDKLYSRKLLQLEELKKSVMQNAFVGKLPKD